MRSEAQRRELTARCRQAEQALEHAQGPDYPASLQGFLGADTSLVRK